MADNFANAMRELSAAAVHEQPRVPATPPVPTDPVATARDLSKLSANIDRIEALLSRRLDNISTNLLPSRANEALDQFKKIEEHLLSIRTSESVNQRLFDSLHDELLKYRDNFLHESLHKPFVRDLIVLFDDLSALSEQLNSAAEGAKKNDRAARWRDNLENAIHSLVEVLHRLEVTEIESKQRVDLAIHKVVNFEPAEFAEDDGRIVMRVKRGFLWRGNVLRPEEVIAKRFQ